MIFSPSARRMAGRLAADHLGVRRGEPPTRHRAPVRPHHQLCSVCGFDRWDGQSQHPRRGVRFARTCTGVPSKDQQANLPAAQVLADELRELAGFTPTPGQDEAPPADPGPLFRVIGDARDL